MAANPRLLLGDEEAALHALAGGLDTIIEVFDVTTNETVSFGSATTPTRVRWIVRYSNGTNKASLVEGSDSQQPDRQPIGHGNHRPASRTGRRRHREPGIILATW